MDSYVVVRFDEWERTTFRLAALGVNVAFPDPRRDGKGRPLNDDEVAHRLLRRADDPGERWDRGSLTVLSGVLERVRDVAVEQSDPAYWHGSMSRMAGPPSGGGVALVADADVAVATLVQARELFARNASDALAVVDVALDVALPVPADPCQRGM